MEGQILVLWCKLKPHRTCVLDWPTGPHYGGRQIKHRQKGRSQAIPQQNGFKTTPDLFFGPLSEPAVNIFKHSVSIFLADCPQIVGHKKKHIKIPVYSTARSGFGPVEEFSRSHLPITNMVSSPPSSVDVRSGGANSAVRDGKHPTTGGLKCESTLSIFNPPLSDAPRKCRLLRLLQ